jgi:hypothetical protein
MLLLTSIIQTLKAPVNCGDFQGFASIREAYIYRLVRLDVYDTVYVFDIDQFKRLRRLVVVALDVDSFAVRFPFDIVTFGDATENDVLHDNVYLRY